MQTPRLTFTKDFQCVRQLLQIRQCADSGKSKEAEIRRLKEIERIKKKISIDNPPAFCCGSGCAQCVYIVWAEALVEKLNVEGPAIAEKVMSMVDDPNIRAFLSHEFRMRGFIKKK